MSPQLNCATLSHSPIILVLCFPHFTNEGHVFKILLISNCIYLLKKQLIASEFKRLKVNNDTHFGDLFPMPVSGHTVFSQRQPVLPFLLYHYRLCIFYKTGNILHKLWDTIWASPFLVCLGDHFLVLFQLHRIPS